MSGAEWWWWAPGRPAAVGLPAPRARRPRPDADAPRCCRCCARLSHSLFAIADKLGAAAAAALAATRSAFDAAAEEEARQLPGGDAATYELWAQLGELLLAGGDNGSTLSTLASVSPAVLLSAAAAAAAGGDAEEALLLPLEPDPAAAAEAFQTAADEASAAFKGKLAQRYFERAAVAEAAAEEAGD